MPAFILPWCDAPHMLSETVARKIRCDGGGEAGCCASNDVIPTAAPTSVIARILFMVLSSLTAESSPAVGVARSYNRNHVVSGETGLLWTSKGLVWPSHSR